MHIHILRSGIPTTLIPQLMKLAISIQRMKARNAFLVFCGCLRGSKSHFGPQDDAKIHKRIDSAKFSLENLAESMKLLVIRLRNQCNCGTATAWYLPCMASVRP